MSNDTIVIDRTEPSVPIVMINRPERRNTLTLAMWIRLRETFDDLAGDQAAKALILTGAGGFFCAGADISGFNDVRGCPEDGERYEAAVKACGSALENLPKVTIAAGEAEKRADEIAAAGRLALESVDYQEGIRACAEKHAPVFHGQ